MAITEFNGPGGHRYDNIRVVRRENNNNNNNKNSATAASDALCAGGTRACFGVIASNADAFHSSGVKAGPHLNNVELSYMLDD